MDNYLILKLLHILSTIVLVGTGVGIAFFMFMANKSNNPQAIYITAKHVVLADWIFTTPAVITQLITGILLMSELNYTFNSPWFYWVIGLFIVIGLCWLPVLRIQYRLYELAKTDQNNNKISPEFKSLMKRWILLGIPAFMVIIIILWLMVFKPFAIM